MPACGGGNRDRGNDACAGPRVRRGAGSARLGCLRRGALARRCVRAAADARAHPWARSLRAVQRGVSRRLARRARAGARRGPQRLSAVPLVAGRDVDARRRVLRDRRRSHRQGDRFLAGALRPSCGPRAAGGTLLTGTVNPTDVTEIVRRPALGGHIPPQLTGLSGIELLRAMLARQFEWPPIHYLTGMSFTEIGSGTAAFTMPITDWLKTPQGIVTGGEVAILADGPLGCAVHSVLPAGV